MTYHKRNPVAVIVAAVAAVAVVTCVKVPFPLVGVQKPFLGYFAAVIVTAWYGGMAGGLLATVVATLAAAFFFVPYSFRATNAEQYVPVAIFAAEGVLISYLSNLLHLARRRAERNRHALQDSERQYRLMVESVRDYAIFMTDRDGTVTKWNTGAEQLLGWREQEIVGQPASVTFTPEDRAHGVDAREMATADRDGHAADERWHQRKDGSRFFGGGMMMRANDEAGRPVGFTKVVRDETGRKLADSRLRTEHAVAVALAEATTLVEAMPGVLESICNVADWDLGGLWAVGQEDGVLRWVAGWHDPSVAAAEFIEVSRRTTLASGVGLPGRVWASREAAWITDVGRDENFPRQEVAVRAGLHGAVCFPVASGGDVRAVMEFFSRSVRPPNEQVLVMMQVVGRQVGEFVRRREAEDALRRGETRQAAVVAAALDCIVAMDHTGRVVEWNQAAERTFGYARAEALGQKMAELIIPASLRDLHRAGLTAYLAGGEGPVIGKRFEITAVRKAGDEFPVELTITRLPTDDPPTFTGFLRDISERRTAEQERGRLLSLEQRARAEAEAALATAERAGRMKDDFLATLSHELRTPLNAILGWSQILRGGGDRPPPAEDLAEGLGAIERNARAQTQIIQDLLDMSGIISGKVRLNVERTDLAAVVRASVDTMRPAADAKGVRLTAVFGTQGMTVSGDPSRLQQVCWNLLANAVKFTPKGGRVRVLVERVESHLDVSVTDTGEGITAEFLPYVFDRFRQADASTTRRHGGLGLGLSIVKQLVELHGGTVRAESDGAGRGTTFTVSLPVVAVQPEPPPHAARPMAAAASANPYGETCIRLEGLKVLVVDDEADARAIVQRILEDCGAVVRAAASVSEALEMFRAVRPDVVVSDIGMPGEDGYALVQRVRAMGRDEGGSTPLLALTAYARPEDRVRAVRAGFNMHVVKPVEPIELVTMVASLVGRS